MEFISNTVKVSLPHYLQNLPIPNTFLGWFRLGFFDWAKLLPPTALLAGITYMSYLAFCPKCRKRFPGAGKINFSVKKSTAKVVDQLDVEDINEKAAFCRCWQSKNWPYCDGSHGEHNERTGDNVGPLLIKNKKFTK